jgi:hypothetical protein
MNGGGGGGGPFRLFFFFCFSLHFAISLILAKVSLKKEKKNIL